MSTEDEPRTELPERVIINNYFLEGHEGPVQVEWPPPGGDPEDPEEPGGPDDDDGAGVDRTGPLLTQQYSGRDTLREAASSATQKIILLFGIIIAALSFLNSAGKTLSIFHLYIKVGILLLLAGMVLGSFVLVRTAANPRPFGRDLFQKHFEVNDQTFRNDGSIDWNALNKLSAAYYSALLKMEEGIGITP